jgi:hypothetical protein
MNQCVKIVLVIFIFLVFFKAGETVCHHGSVSFSRYTSHVVPEFKTRMTYEEVVDIIAREMKVTSPAMPVIKDMTQEDFDLSHFKETCSLNEIRSTWPRFFYKENVINYSHRWPLDRLAHEVVHYFQKCSGIDMDHDDIYYDLEEQASEIQMWFRSKHSHRL